MVAKTFTWSVNKLPRKPQVGIQLERTAHERCWFIQGAMDAMDGRASAEGIQPAAAIDPQTWEAYRLGYEAGRRYKGRKAGRS